MLRYKAETRPGLVALYDIRPGNGAGQFLQPRSPHGANTIPSRLSWTPSVPFTSVVIHSMNQSSSCTMSKPSQFFFIIKFNGSSTSNSLISAFHFLSMYNNIHLSILTSVLSNFISCSIFIGQVSLLCIRQLLA